jgi:radical SAM protein with 4Fe4S-binding SPASM domain
MKDNLFFDVIDRCVSEEVEHIDLGGFGDPLMDKSILNKTEYAKQKGLRVSLTTNAMLLNEKKTDQLLDYGVDGIAISFDSIVKKDYENLRVGLNFDVVTNNIFNLLDNIREKELDTRVVVSCVALPDEDISEDFKNYFREYDDLYNFGISFIPLHNWSGEVGEKSSGIIRVPCERLFSDSVIVRVDGSLSLCCMDFNNLFSLGNVVENGLVSSWNSDKMKMFRKLHLSGRWDDMSICRTCSDSYMKITQ